MSEPFKKSLKVKEKEIIENKTALYTQLKELVLLAFETCIIRDVIKEYRYNRQEKYKEYNTVATFLHVAMGSLALLQLWKVFDKKSTLNVFYVIKYMPFDVLKNWFARQIKILKPDIDYLSAWRNNFVGHRSGASHFEPKKLEIKLNTNLNAEKRIKEFLLDLLCQIEFEIYGNKKLETRENLISILDSYKRFISIEKDKILIK